MSDNRKSRRAVEAQGAMTEARFLKIADGFIDHANRQNRAVKASDLHMCFLYGASRYSAHVAKNVLQIEEHEPFVQEMTKAFQEMLRTHLADPDL